jgi:vancomycin permeability regulator SanA
MIKKRSLQLLLALSAWFIAHTAVITIDGLNDELEKSDCILVLGNKVNEDGSLSGRLKARLDKALELYNQGMAAKIIVSGGLGKEGHYEGSAMKDYLVKQGVPEASIIVDDNGIDTHATAVNYDSIAKENEFRSVIIVSQFYHITRTRLALKKQGITTIYSAHAEYFEWRDLYSLTREFFGYYKYLLFAS